MIAIVLLLALFFICPTKAMEQPPDRGEKRTVLGAFGDSVNEGFDDLSEPNELNAVEEESDRPDAWYENYNRDLPVIVPTAPDAHRYRPLLVAAARDDLAGVIRALQSGPQWVNAADEYTRTALLFAIENHNLEMMLILLRTGADPNILIFNPDYERSPLICIACNMYNRHPRFEREGDGLKIKMIRALLEAGAHRGPAEGVLFPDGTGGESVQHELFECGLDPYACKRWHGSNVAHLFLGKMVRIFLEFGAHVDAQGLDGDSCLVRMIRHIDGNANHNSVEVRDMHDIRSYDNAWGVIRECIRGGAHVPNDIRGELFSDRIQEIIESAFRNNQFFLAAACGNVTMLESHVTDLTPQEEFDEALVYAVAQGQIMAVNWLLGHRAHPERAHHTLDRIMMRETPSVVAHRIRNLRKVVRLIRGISDRDLSKEHLVRFAGPRLSVRQRDTYARIEEILRRRLPLQEQIIRRPSFYRTVTDNFVRFSESLREIARDVLLLRAIQLNDLRFARQALKAGADVRNVLFSVYALRDYPEMAALIGHYARERGMLFDPPCVRKWCVASFFNVLRRGSVEGVSLALHSGANANGENGVESALSIAAFHHDVDVARDMVELLLCQHAWIPDSLLWRLDELGDRPEIAFRINGRAQEQRAIQLETALFKNE